MIQSLINTSSNTVTQIISLPSARPLFAVTPLGVTYDFANGDIYVADQGIGNVSVISTLLPLSAGVCPPNYIQHWDKIIFNIVSPTLAKKVNLTANTEIDIKVLDSHYNKAI